MKVVAAFLLGAGLFATLGLSGLTQEKKEEKKETKKDTDKVELPKLEGKYKLVGGKINNMDVNKEAKDYEYTFTTEKITIKGEKLKFVMGYKLDGKTTPINIDMEILEGPEGTKGIKVGGIIEVKGEVVKLAYNMEKEKDKGNDAPWKRPKDFEGKEGNAFELKKLK